MKLKTSLLLMGALTTFSCTNVSNEFKISKFYPVGAGCDIEANREKFITGNGYLDVAAGNPTVVVGLAITGAQDVEQLPITVGQVKLEAENRNRPIVTSMEVTYRLSKRVGGTPKPYIQTMTLPFSDDGEIFGAFQILSPDLGQALFDGLLPSPGTAPSNTIEDFVDINIDVMFRGEFNKTRTPFNTGTLTYPIRAYRSNPITCSNGYVKFGADPTTGAADVCSYVGFSGHQLAQPAPPSCCSVMGPMGGPGC